VTYDGHLIEDRQRTVAVYRVATLSYPLLPDPEKAGVLDAWSRWAHKIAADFSVYRVTRYVSPGDHARQARALADPEWRRRGWDTDVTAQADAIAGLQAWRVECYVAASLTSRQQAAEGVDVPKLVRHAVAGLRDARGRRAADDLHDRERHVRDALAALRGRPATPLEVQWLFRRAPVRGVREPRVDEYHRHRPDRTLQRLRDRWTDDPEAEDARTLVLGERHDHNYQTVMAVGARPEEIEFPGCEYMLHPVEQVPFPVDLALHVRWVSNADALTWAGQKVRDADGAWAEATAATAEPPTWKVGEDRRLTRDLVRYLQHPSRPPLLWGSLSAAFSAPTRAELEKRRRAVDHAYGAVQVETPRFVQQPYWWDHVPGTTGQHQTRYEEPMTTDELGSLAANGTHETGDRHGGLVAYTTGGGVRRPVLIDLAAAPREGRPPGWLIDGAYGSGKTLVAEFIAYQHALRGARVVTIDPKGDHYLTRLPALAGDALVMRMTGGDDDQGLLDPLVIEDGEMAVDRALSYYTDLIPGIPREWQTQLLKAIKEVVAERNPCGRAVIERLLSADSRDAVNVGEELALQADSGLRRLGFADGTTRRVSAKRVTTIRTPGLVLPPAAAHRGNYSRDEQTGVATMKLLTGFTLRLLGDDRSQLKVIVMDELHAFRGNDGARVIERVLHYGRSYNAAALFLAQLDSMLDEEVVRLVGARASMMRAGEGVLRHPGGAARIQVLVPPEILRVLDTSPAGEGAAHGGSANGSGNGRGDATAVPGW
jgi:hypothetical protein